MVRFCEAHYRELDERWNGIKRAYGNEEVVIDNDNCQHLDCIRKIRMACPYCLREVTPRQLIRLRQQMPELQG